MTDSVKFTFVEFNPVRDFRGAPAARVRVTTASGDSLLWMTERNIAENAKLYGWSEGLLQARNAYPGHP